MFSNDKIQIHFLFEMEEEELASFNLKGFFQCKVLLPSEFAYIVYFVTPAYIESIAIHQFSEEKNFFAEPGLIIIPEITKTIILHTVNILEKKGFFDHLISCPFFDHDISTIKAHTKEITCCKFSPEGNHILTGSADNSLKLWDKTLYSEIQSFIGHTGKITCCSFSIDGDLFVSGSVDRTVKVWKTFTGELLKTYSFHKDEVTFCYFSNDGMNIISGSKDQSVIIASLYENNPIQVLSNHQGPENYDIINPDGKWVISCEGDKITKWNISTGEFFPSKRLHEKKIVNCSFSHDGRYLLTLSQDCWMKIWNFSNMTLICAYNCFIETENATCNFSKDLKSILVTTGGSKIQLWEGLSEHIYEQAISLPYEVYFGSINFLTAEFHPYDPILIAGAIDGSLVLLKIKNNSQHYK